MVMRDDTPYRERPERERAHEKRCVGELLRHASPVDTVWESFGGLGDVAVQLTDRFPQAHVIACDLDQQCVDMYNDRMRREGRRAMASGRDARLGPPDLAGRWAASLDFNRFTVMDLVTDRAPWKRDLLAAVLQAENPPQWVHLTDSARRYLHLNWARYGCADGELATYVERLDGVLRDRHGWHVANYVGYHSATYLLLERNEA